LVQRTIEHISGKDGLAISGVYYEVWNEPDLFGDYKTYGDRNYLELYMHSTIGAARAGNVLSFKLGGPATTKLYENWFKSFFEFAANNNLRVDFFSWHHYSKSMFDFEEDVGKVKAWISDYPKYKDVEFLITEIGLNSENDPGNDSYFGAIHTIATAATLEDSLDRIFNFEIKDGPGTEKLWGRWGILTHEKFGQPEIKPRYNALLFLNRMQGGKTNVAGVGSWIKAFAKKDGNNTTRLLVVNYDETGKHNELVPITFTSLTSANFTFRRINFSGGVDEVQIATTSATWATQQLFEPNTASIFEIIPK